MKKTLIALAVAASAAVSGSAMAWTANGTGDSVDLGGTLSPADVVTQWEVKTGNGVTTLNADVKKGQSVVNIAVKQAIPVLGIRTQTAEAFQGQPGIYPKINYGNAVDVDNFAEGVTTLTLDVKEGDAKIGTMSVDFFAGAAVSRANVDGTPGDAYSAYSEDLAFSGGLGVASANIVNGLSEVIARVNAIDPEVGAHFNRQNSASVDNWRATAFEDVNTKYSAFYGSGIESGKTIRITLDKAVAGDADISWKASLPVTVSYH